MSEQIVHRDQSGIVQGAETRRGDARKVGERGEPEQRSRGFALFCLTLGRHRRCARRRISVAGMDAGCA